MSSKPAVHVFWFRRDLRLNDNAGLYYALRTGKPVVPVFIFDTEILDELEDKHDIRVQFIMDALEGMQKELRSLGSTLHVLHGTPAECYKQLLKEYDIDTVFTNHDYEPYARQRDEEIGKMLKEHGARFLTFKDQVIFERDEVVKDNGEPYTVYTPYSKRWRQKLNDFYLKPYPTEKYFANFYKQAEVKLPSLEQIGFEKATYDAVLPWLDPEVARHYADRRDYPAMNGTTRLSVHLRFGTISIRQLAAETKDLSDKLFGELIWRDFYQCIMWHYPQVVSQSFKPEYDRIQWRNNEEEFARWCAGQTGYPIVDAGMRQMNETGYMHNRVRMVVASFLTKHLLIDWRWGEAYFAKKLLDYDLASNNGGWQWAAGCGCDAAPYFRIFNPQLQTEKFDGKMEYIKRWVPEYDQLTYAWPIVQHEVARDRCLKVYKAALAR